jgi:hypothetical protein
MELLGLAPARVRPPLGTMAAEDRPALRALLDRLGATPALAARSA